MKYYFLAGFLLVGLFSNYASADSTELPGWQQTYEESANAVVYTHGNNAGTIIFYPTASIETGDSRTRVQRFLQNQLAYAKAPAGSAWSSQPEISRNSINYSDGYRQYDSGTLYGMAFSADNKHARLGIFLSNSTTDAVTLEQGVKFLATQLVKLEMADAKKHNRNIKMEVPPPKVKGLTTGIPFKPGLYAGNRTRSGKVLQSIKILFYANGEYEYLSGARNKRNSGTYAYSKSGGKFDADRTFFNSPNSPQEKYSAYGLNENNIPTAVAFERFGYDGYTTRVMWQEPIDPDRLTPIQRAEAEKKNKAQDKAIASAERRANKGGIEGLASLRDRAPLIPNSKILGVGITPGKAEYVLDYASGLTVPQISNEIPYLALKDGTVIRNPAPPADTDLDKYRKLSNTPEQKTRVAEDRLYRPLKRGYTLDIYAEHNRAGVGGPTFKSLLMNKEGFFKYSNTTMMMSANIGFSYGRNISSNEMSGTYFIDGNTIELKHNDGKIERLLFGTDGKNKVMVAATEYLVPDQK